MKELEIILQDILEVYNKEISNDEKFREVSELWTKYYQLGDELGIQLDLAYRLYLMCENECYKIYQEPVMKGVDIEEVVSSVDHLRQVLENRKQGIQDGITRKEAKLLLDYVVNHVRNSFGLLGIDIQTNSLNGFCELGQALSIMPFENIGLRVTKNKASEAFGYSFNHAFGTVWFPILENNQIEDVGYLVDTTYRQFFSSVRCNEGRYYAREENTGMIANPDPGYFVYDEQFAKTLMRDGYILFDSDTAYKYGEGFYLSSLGINDRKEKEGREFDYYHSILNSSTEYSIRFSELEGLDVDCLNFGGVGRLKK